MIRNQLLFCLILGCLTCISCGDKKEKDTQDFKIERKATESAKIDTAKEEQKPSERIDLNTLGVGPIKSVSLDPEIDSDLAAAGEKLYGQLCIACHKVGKRFIGPAPNGILKRRSPEWVMNMILAPEIMVKEDPLAKELLQEFNGSPMSNQGLTEDQARAILEYFRTLE
ncbi:Cytochrome c, mono-and diheme variants [Robiginitalea myxolifaciens]|uniref:Cytochrome c, mono-and diheme variants n=1 Tax=Robiginitalea myxolifaciens TaxID=400055 RepID=A0A1I6FY82_9FLAO|nr:cytochrome c [Robiginitalea myxolifaciens]SFR34893.1 Cytochrome c, mono-and diheme variants [Robiginitalea myxolifaciens]